MAKGDSEYIYFYVADIIRIIEIEYVLKYLLGLLPNDTKLCVSTITF